MTTVNSKDNSFYIKWRYHYLHLHAHFKSKNQIFIIVSVVLTLSFIVLTSYLLLKINSPNPQVLGTTSTNLVSVEIPLPTVIPTQPKATPVTESDSGVYQIAITTQPAIATISNVLLADALVNTLALPLIANQPYPIKKIIYDTLEQDPWSATGPGLLNGRYYLIVSPQVKLQTQLYTSPWLTIDVKPAAHDLLPFLSDQKFCLSDSDCLVRKSYCQTGAYNRYDIVLDSYSCHIDNSSRLAFFDSQQNCPAVVGFVSPKCSANRCLTNEVNICLSPSPTQ